MRTMLTDVLAAGSWFCLGGFNGSVVCDTFGLPQGWATVAAFYVGSWALALSVRGRYALSGPVPSEGKGPT